MVAIVPTGCTGLTALFGPLPGAWNTSGTNLDMAVAIVEPITATTAAPGAATVIQWADIAKTEGTVVRVAAQQQNAAGEDVGDPIHIIGDGTVGSGRDAQADGDSDIVEWNLTGVRVGTYVVTITIENPDGTTETSVSKDDDLGTTGVITVITALPVPTFTFVAPGAADETVNAGNTFDITWTDNGDANADALVLLGLDTDSDHESGNEIVLVRNQALSTNGTDGLFTFNFQDENGIAVPDDTYTVYAIVDDSANEIVTANATGHLIAAP